jgi:hypothetical protein
MVVSFSPSTSASSVTQASPLESLVSNRTRAESPRAWNIADARSSSARSGSFRHKRA